MNATGYNIFVLDPQGTGKSTYTQSVVDKVAMEQNVQNDWCYINNLSDWDKNLVLGLQTIKINYLPALTW